MRRHSLDCLLVVTALLAAITSGFAQVAAADEAKTDPLDWPHWRGPEYNGISRETGLIDSWSPKGKGENVLWVRKDLGSRSTPIVMRGKLYMMVRSNPGTAEEGEKVVCLDAATGEDIWENSFNVYLSDVPDTRVSWSSLVGDPATGHVYALGVCGYFQCIDGETGETIWSHSLSEEYGLLSTYGGRTNFPIVHEDLVIISAIIIGWGDMAKPAHRFIAFDKRNGQPVWFTGTRLLPYDTTYSSPVLAELNGQEALVFGSGDGGVHAFQPQTGKKLWTYNVSRRGLNVSPLVVDGRVYSGHSEENLTGTYMGSLFAIDGNGSGDVTKSHELWRHERVMAGKSSPIMVDGKLLVVDDRGTIFVVDPETGKRLSKRKVGRSNHRSSPLYADGKIYVTGRSGKCSILKLDGDKLQKVHETRLPGRMEAHGSPIVSHGRIYLPMTGGLYCLGRKGHEPAADPIPKRKITPKSPTDKPAQLQVVPVEALLKPGQKLQFQARLYNDRGQFLKLTNAEYHIDGPGTISADGKYEAAGDAAHSAVTVTAKADGLEGTARIRVVPPFPWKFDFEDGQVPITWVGARYRNIVLDFDLLKKLEQQNPLAAQLYIYVMSGFINSGRSTVKYVDDNPRRTWSALLRFLDLLDGKDAVRNMADAEERLGPALQLLTDEKVIQSWNFLEKPIASPDPVVGEEKIVELTIQRGSRQIDGNGVMVKITTIPKGARSQSWMGHIDFDDYTIQADVMGVRKNGKLPDIGLIGQRYTLDLMGEHQQLQIRTWPPQLRMAQSIPFAWEPNVWYTLKMRTAVEGDKAVLRGKVWKRGEPEPEEWMIEATDIAPNVIGSPGLYGNAKDAEVFIDNVQITRNRS